MNNDYNKALLFKQVNYSVDGLHILKNITGSIPKGKITTLVGPSGSGKTTLFKLCNGLQSPDSGDIYINDKPINSYDPVKLRRNVGIALQNAAMISGSVMKNLSLPLDLQEEKLSEERAKELLHLVGMNKDSLQRNTKDLSGGQRQKISIARTLVNKPKILLLDEITSSLDSVSRQDIEELITKINHTYDTTIFWITHNLQQAMTIGDYTWAMMDGEIIETGESNFLKDPKEERMKDFVRGEVE
ncbi:phosphate ABC transporter ATP-binding protein, PhoT family [Virgibacillus subterraneus]|uniref:Phosphate ABC transporter ATP-binding protein, PhoT family n=1 Tax=Virgibacillus subterraneus TaxID=621109 RepID=A0A1H9HTT5_9BACI|nr:phosphate ABC transporter ATP-binding protein [Virgibacillus subterraneus]SEQ65697.1 phosphate ABC transporter ATP-binding protein, PhoT family [Virgibacillus subterraneus]